MLARFALDTLLWTISSVLCIIWRLVADKDYIWSYIILFAGMMLLWTLTDLLSGGSSRSYKQTRLRKEWLWLAIRVAVVWTAVELLPYCPFITFTLSLTVARWMIGIVTIIDALGILLLHYYKYAMEMEVKPMEIQPRENANVKRKDEVRSDKSQATIREAVLSITTEADYRMLRENARLDSSQTKIVANREIFSLLQLPEYQYRTIVDLTLLNDMRSINQRFCRANQKLPDDGIYVCCYRPQEYMKQKFLAKYPRGLNWLMYGLYFFQKRVLPRLMLTARVYFDITRGRKRMLSKTEVLGRLYYCGFEVDEVIPMGHIDYVFAHRHSQPYPQVRHLYGPLIKLPRVSQNKEIVYFYKFRTMHPYAEYIQQYVFEQGGGMDIADKSSNDWRISNWGSFVRKYWLDELPMLLNWIQGDMKLVGVRPLSQTMFNNYPPYLQDLRTQVKPGLIPPFYIDHPKTFDELFASEEKYLRAYMEHPIKTDFVYFWRTVHSILFKKMHSA